MHGAGQGMLEVVLEEKNKKVFMHNRNERSIFDCKQ